MLQLSFSKACHVGINSISKYSFFLFPIQKIVCFWGHFLKGNIYIESKQGKERSKLFSVSLSINSEIEFKYEFQDKFNLKSLCLSISSYK